jgi:hypothetical protein
VPPLFLESQNNYKAAALMFATQDNYKIKSQLKISFATFIIRNKKLKKWYEQILGVVCAISFTGKLIFQIFVEGVSYSEDYG